jgi:hypothetical protein
MPMFRRVLALTFFAALAAHAPAALSQSLTPAGPSQPAATDDAYTSLHLYDGAWDVTSSDPSKPLSHLQNHCARTGLFFMCEQVVDGKSLALVCFLPVAKVAEGVQEYKTQVLAADATTPGDWSSLTIDGNHWVFSSQATVNGKKTYFQTVNTFTGNDKIHFDIQRSDDGRTWKTQESGDEARVVS